MAATTTLLTVTLAANVRARDGEVQLSGTNVTSVVPGRQLFLDRELMTVVTVRTFSSTSIEAKVIRGVSGTGTGRHASGSLMTLGRPDQFYMDDPTGVPPDGVLVSPWINVLNGRYWVAQGDEAGPGLGGRYWALLEVTHGIGSLGVRTTSPQIPQVTATTS